MLKDSKKIIFKTLTIGNEGGFVEAKNQNRDEFINDIRVVNDFLPPPAELVFKEDTVKVRLELSRRSIEFFKQEAKKHHTQYRKMIRTFSDLYTAHHQ